jgi:2-keto-4-pentenoate hydratase/2-oxohepta-3-ene-1,7-dioic acid hydratase in catechol pathway
MKLVRYGAKGREKPGILDAQGKLRDLSAHCETFGWDEISPAGIKRLRKIAPASLPLVMGNPRLGVPFTGISKIIGVGLNYREHARETGATIPAEPVLFMKATTAINGPFDNIVLPRGSTKTDWEAELGLVIGKTARYVEEAQALSYLAGYVTVHDVSERDFQKNRGGSWDKGKGCDTFAPIGPWLVTPDEVKDPQTLRVWSSVNGAIRQDSNTADMIFPCTFLISYISQFMTLNPGDVICTGTPSGVGLGMTPPQFLKAGDVVRIGVADLGEQCQMVVAG